MPTIPQGRVSAASPPHRSPLARGGGGETKTASFQILEPRAYSQQWPRTRAPSPDRPERVALHEKLQASASPARATEPSVEVGEPREPWRRIGTWCASWIRQGFGNSNSDGLSIKQGGRTAIPSNTLLETSSTMRGRDSWGRAISASIPERAAAGVVRAVSGSEADVGDVVANMSRDGTGDGRVVKWHGSGSHRVAERVGLDGVRSTLVVIRQTASRSRAAPSDQVPGTWFVAHPVGALTANLEGCQRALELEASRRTSVTFKSLSPAPGQQTRSGLD
ncbi:hypothetical protein PCL_03628 [Purpureocillium lilacinum]|uniref:Uncharacterized protein n=1 Tax=Purpureocillium lilacinum TaxID=33203 RepID=A0A2U3EPJ5_PURLI|nr:hypothetical protein PCL_03628 [Purpureocillium lilacinum]